MAKKEKKRESVMDIARQMEAQAQAQEQEARRLALEQAERERKQYEQQLREERLELLRLKQGVIDRSETIHEEHEEKPHYTLGQRIGNFFYHNKWWLGIACFFAFVTGFLIWQTVTTVKPDMIVLLLVHDDYFNAACNEQIGALFSQYVGDENGDGRVQVDVYYIPASDETADRSGYTGDATKLFAEFQIGEAVLVISDEGADQFIVPEHTLTDLAPYFGDYAQTDGVRFMLADTDFAQAVGWEEDLDKDIYIGIRQVRETMDSEEKMQKVYDISFPALEQFVADFGTPETTDTQEDTP